MGATNQSSSDMSPLSALQTYITTNTSSTSPHPAHLQHLTLQICHNLQYQHNWTSLTIHHYAPIESSSTTGKRKRTPLPRPLISGLPPKRLYVHPDEQIALLQAAKKTITETNGKDGEANLLKMVKPDPEREWILPTHLQEKWSLSRFGEVFDQIGFVPPDGGGENDLDEEIVSDADKARNPWRTKKRVLLATLDDDSTVMYYIVHDGIVKPRQN
ncbi:tRNA-splicing endonuclease subunit Sen15 [Elsinoe ampelina]|uniref:tRNA-splicing endonuclease subunit Sen15 n=1 Tax=Elsinoe ampelina TaxID=302913 RepID=A0A6A6G8B4_9PEZI|nr:tRNA-splicing endonuclease subunit Sen15 [Elsinoe ampelina]